MDQPKNENNTSTPINATLASTTTDTISELRKRLNGHIDDNALCFQAIDVRFNHHVEHEKQEFKDIRKQIEESALHSNTTAIIVLRWWADHIQHIIEADNIYSTAKDNYRQSWLDETIPSLKDDDTVSGTWRIHSWHDFWPVGYAAIACVAVGIALFVVESVMTSSIAPFIVGAILILALFCTGLIVVNCVKNFIRHELTSYHNIEAESLRQALLAVKLAPGMKDYDRGLFTEIDRTVFRGKVSGLYRPYAAEFLNQVIMWLCRNPKMTLSDASEHFSDQIHDFENLSRLVYSERK